MNLAVIILLLVYISLCVVVIGGWAFKTMEDVGIERFDEDDDVIPNWDDEIDEFDDAEEQGNLL